MMMKPEEVLTFWFEEIDAASWWKKDESFDREIERRFRDVHAQAIKCECYAWRSSPRGRLAEIIVLDQFSRNIYRDHALSFAADPLALALAQEAISVDADAALTPTERNFLYMPFMHSESLMIHEVAVVLFAAMGKDGNLNFELKHKKIIDVYERYPHRNEILGRESTEAEIEFLKGPGSGF